VLQAHLALQEVQRSAASEGWQDLNLVFPSGIGSIFLPSILVHRHWYVLLERSGCRRIRFHDLRHTHARLAIRAGMDVRLLVDRLGHKDPAFTLRVYAHVFDRRKQGGALSLETLLADPIEWVT
jgi:integrase